MTGEGGIRPRRHRINSVTVAAPSVPLLPAMISLHLDTVQSIERED